jgi:ribosomal protein S18 acetylase RimI-like enzyme
MDNLIGLFTNGPLPAHVVSRTSTNGNGGNNGHGNNQSNVVSASTKTVCEMAADTSDHVQDELVEAIKDCSDAPEMDMELEYNGLVGIKMDSTQLINAYFKGRERGAQGLPPSLDLAEFNFMDKRAHLYGFDLGLFDPSKSFDDGDFSYDNNRTAFEDAKIRGDNVHNQRHVERRGYVDGLVLDFMSKHNMSLASILPGLPSNYLSSPIDTLEQLLGTEESFEEFWSASNLKPPVDERNMSKDVLNILARAVGFSSAVTRVFDVPISANEVPMTRDTMVIWAEGVNAQPRELPFKREKNDQVVLGYKDIKKKVDPRVMMDEMMYNAGLRIRLHSLGGEAIPPNAIRPPVALKAFNHTLETGEMPFFGYNTAGMDYYMSLTANIAPYLKAMWYRQTPASRAMQSIGNLFGYEGKKEEAMQAFVGAEYGLAVRMKNTSNLLTLLGGKKELPKITVPAEVKDDIQKGKGGLDAQVRFMDRGNNNDNAFLAGMVGSATSKFAIGVVKFGDYLLFDIDAVTPRAIGIVAVDGDEIAGYLSIHYGHGSSFQFHTGFFDRLNVISNEVSGIAYKRDIRHIKKVRGYSGDPNILVLGDTHNGNINYSSNSCYVRNIIVRPEYRREGIGEQMLRFATSIARNKFSSENMFVECVDETGTRDFFKVFGFKELMYSGPHFKNGQGLSTMFLNL